MIVLLSFQRWGPWGLGNGAMTIQFNCLRNLKEFGDLMRKEKMCHSFHCVSVLHDSCSCNCNWYTLSMSSGLAVLCGGRVGCCRWCCHHWCQPWPAAVEGDLWLGGWIGVVVLCLKKLLEPTSDLETTASRRTSRKSKGGTTATMIQGAQARTSRKSKTGTTATVMGGFFECQCAVQHWSKRCAQWRWLSLISKSQKLRLRSLGLLMLMQMMRTLNSHLEPLD